MVVMETACVERVAGYERCPLKKRPLRMLNTPVDEDKKKDCVEPENLCVKGSTLLGQENKSLLVNEGVTSPTCIYKSIDHILSAPLKPPPQSPLCNDAYYDWAHTDNVYNGYSHYSNPFLSYPHSPVIPFTRCHTEVYSPVGHVPTPVHRMSPYAPTSPSQTSPTFKASLSPSSSSAFHEYKPNIPLPSPQSHSPVPLSGSDDEGRKRESPKYRCESCHKSYCTIAGLSKHQQQHCTAQDPKSFECKHCDKLYTSLGALKMHIRTHTLPCKCHLCGKAFSRPWLLQGHIRTHTGEKPFSCPQCHRAFADRSNLRAHLQTHSEVKKYCCKSCDRTFSRLSLLVKHQESGCGDHS